MYPFRQSSENRSIMKVLNGIDGSTLFQLILTQENIYIANDVVDVLRAFAADESAQDYFETIK